MKRLLLILLLAISPVIYTGCTTPPTARNVTVSTLKAVGHTAEAAVELSAQLYADGKITAVQARAVFDFYNDRFQPPYRVAVIAARFDTAALAPQELLNLATELTALVASYQRK